MPVRANRACRIILAALILFLAAAAVPGRTAAESEVTIGRIVDGVWKLDPINYTYRTLQNTKELNLSGKGIRAIEGIEYLSGLYSLDLSYNEMESLDLSSCTRLTELNCSGNRLTALDLSACRKLKKLSCSDNALGELDVTALKNLQVLDCRNCGLKALNLDENRSLTEIYCSGNELSAIDVTHLKKLKALAVRGVGLTSLDVSRNEQLITLDCSGNPGLKELNLKANSRLKELFTAGTGIMNLDLSKQRTLESLFGSRNGYGYELGEDARIWKLEEGWLTTNPDAAIQIGSTITIRPAREDPQGQVALPGYTKYKPGEFTNRILSSSYDEMCHYFRMTVGPNRSVFSKVDEKWIYENAHTVVEAAGLAVQARQFSTIKLKSATRAFTVFDADGNFKFRCTVDYMDGEDAIEYARRLNKDHEEAPDEADLLGYTGQVNAYSCGNALIIMEGIPSTAQERTPTLESYIMSDPENPLYLIR